MSSSNNSDDELDSFLDDLDNKSKEDPAPKKEAPVKKATTSKEDDVTLNTLKEEYKVIKDEKAIEKAYHTITADKKKALPNLPEKVLKSIILANVRKELDKLKQSEKIHFIVTGKNKRENRKTNTYSATVWGIVIDQKDRQKQAPMKLSTTSPNEEGVNVIDEAELYCMYEVFIVKSGDKKINWAAGHTTPNLIWMGDSTNFKKKIRSASNSSLIANYEKYYSLKPKTKIDEEDGLEEICSGVSMLGKPTKDGRSFAMNDDYKILVLIPSSNPREFGMSASFTAYPVGDDTEKVSVWLHPDRQFTNWDSNTHALIVVGSVSRNATQDYSQFTVNAIAIEAIEQSALAQFYQ